MSTTLRVEVRDNQNSKFSPFLRPNNIEQLKSIQSALYYFENNRDIHQTCLLTDQCTCAVRQNIICLHFRFSVNDNSHFLAYGNECVVVNRLRP